MGTKEFIKALEDQIEKHGDTPLAFFVDGNEVDLLGVACSGRTLERITVSLETVGLDGTIQFE